jgi:hypothetical protein
MLKKGKKLTLFEQKSILEHLGKNHCVFRAIVRWIYKTNVLGNLSNRLTIAELRILQVLTFIGHLAGADSNKNLNFSQLEWN